MKRWKCVSKIQLFQICCSILRPLSLANAVSQCPVSFLYLAGLDIMTNGWYWHIESSRLTHFPYWRCPLTRSHMMTCHTLREAFFSLCLVRKRISIVLQSIPINSSTKTPPKGSGEPKKCFPRSILVVLKRLSDYHFANLWWHWSSVWLSLRLNYDVIFC